MSEQILLDADSHVSEPLNLWQERLPEKYRSIAPHMEYNLAYHIWISDRDEGCGGVRLS